jgi:hypothetical protein
VGALIALWPGESTHEATAVVSVGHAEPGHSAADFTFDAAPEARAGAVGSLIALVRSHPALDVHVVAHAHTQRGAIRAAQETVDLAETTAKAVLVGQTPQGAQQLANLQSKAGDAEIAAAKLQAAQRAIDDWHRGHGNEDPAQQLAVVDAALARARAATPQNDLLVAQLQEQQAQLASAETEFSHLLQKHEAADRAAKRAKAAFDHARTLARPSDARAQADVVASNIREAVVDKARPRGRLALAAIFFIVAIGAADVLFLTRKRLVVPYADETTRARRARRRRQRQQRRAHKPRTHRPSTAHNWHAWQADVEDAPAQHPQERR